MASSYIIFDQTVYSVNPDRGFLWVKRERYKCPLRAVGTDCKFDGFALVPR